VLGIFLSLPHAENTYPSKLFCRGKMPLTIASKLDTSMDRVWKKAMTDNRILNPTDFAEFMLSKTSRTFALNIQVLSPKLRIQVLLAYLFCRMADTLEDDIELPPNQKVALLEDFKQLFPPGPNFERRMATFSASLPIDWANSDRWDRLLVAHSHWIFPLLTPFPKGAIKSISVCVQEMCDGMIQFTRRQTAMDSGKATPVLIETIQDLDRYCYYVAGTVGNLLCDLFAQHSLLIGVKRANALKSLSVSFGLGLQLTNILKDIQDDRLRNVSFIPLSLLHQEGLTEVSFLTSEGKAGARRIMIELIQKAKSHLKDALEYTCLIPRLEPRLRLFCLWPLFMAAETMVMLANNLEGYQDVAKMKISRSQVKLILRKTSLVCWSNHLLRSMFNATLSRLEARLESATV
jgi:farnesyl-diphosphate farnesyltransferase